LVSDLIEVLNGIVTPIYHVHELVRIHILFNLFLILQIMALHKPSVTPHKINLVWIINNPAKNLMEELLLWQHEMNLFWGLEHFISFLFLY
jgi:hypothetical protein